MKSCGKKTTRKLKNKKADDGNRTRLSSLGSWRSTDELHLPKCGDRSENFCRFFYFILKYLICQIFFMTGLCQVFVGTFFVFRNSVEKLCVSWALSLVECVAVWALKLPVPHTDILKTHSSQSFSTELLESKGTGSEHLSQTRHSKLSFSLSYKRIPKCLSGCGCCCIY